MMVGVIFSLDTISFFMTAICMQRIPEKNKNYFVLLLLGCAIFTTSTFFQGPCPGIMPDEVGFIGFGIFIGGIAGGLILINAVPSTNSAVFKNRPKEFSLSPQGQRAKNSLSAINTGANAFGQITGPILGSSMVGILGYRSAFLVITLIFLTYTLIMFTYFIVDRIRQKSLNDDFVQADYAEAEGPVVQKSINEDSAQIKSSE